MKWLTIIIPGVLVILGACASDPVYTVPAHQTVDDYVATSQLAEVEVIRKGDRDSWQYVNDRYVIYRGRPDTFLVEFKHNCNRLTDNSIVPVDVIHDHRNLRATDTIRGCIVDKMYMITNDQRIELRHLGQTPGENN